MRQQWGRAKNKTKCFPNKRQKEQRTRGGYPVEGNNGGEQGKGKAGSYRISHPQEYRQQRRQRRLHNTALASRALCRLPLS